MNQKNKYRLLEIAEKSKFILDYCLDKSFDDFINDKKVLSATEFCLIRIGLAVSRLELKLDSSVPVKREEMKFLSKHLIEEYYAVDLPLVWEMVENKIKPLKSWACQTLVSKS